MRFLAIGLGGTGLVVVGVLGWAVVLGLRGLPTREASHEFSPGGRDPDSAVAGVLDEPGPEEGVRGGPANRDLAGVRFAPPDASLLRDPHRREVDDLEERPLLEDG